MKLASSFGRYDEEWYDGDWYAKGDVPCMMILDNVSKSLVQQSMVATRLEM